MAYETLAGAHPFAHCRTPQAMVAAHISETPAALLTLCPDLPPAVAALVMGCLSKDPEQRPAVGDALLERLASASATSAERIAAPVVVAVPSPMTASRQRTIFVAGVTLLAMVVGGLWIARTHSPRGSVNTDASALQSVAANTAAAEPAGAISALAVLPFVNTSGNASDVYFSDGLTDELAHGLLKLPGLRLAARTSSFAFKGKTLEAAEVGRALNVGAIIEGTVRRAGNRIRLTAQLTSTRDGQLLWSDAFERTGADVFAVQDAFTTAIVSALTPRLAGASTGSVNPTTPVGVAARGTTDAVA